MMIIIIIIDNFYGAVTLRPIQERRTRNAKTTF